MSKIKMVDPLPILRQWKYESGNKSLVQYKYSARDGKLIIYTSRIGWMIGLHGELVNKFNKILNDNLRGFKEIEFVEVNSKHI